MEASTAASKTSTGGALAGDDRNVARAVAAANRTAAAACMAGRTGSTAVEFTLLGAVG